VVAATGIKRLSVTCNGKNASSSSFILLISFITLTRTA
jgi:predicted acetyltransferase